MRPRSRPVFRRIDPATSCTLRRPCHAQTSQEVNSRHRGGACGGRCCVCWRQPPLLRRTRTAASQGAAWQGVMPIGRQLWCCWGCWCSSTPCCQVTDAAMAACRLPFRRRWPCMLLWWRGSSLGHARNRNPAVTVATTAHRLSTHRCRRGDLQCGAWERQYSGLHVHQCTQQNRPSCLPQHRRSVMRLQQRRTRNYLRIGDSHRQELL